MSLPPNTHTAPVAEKSNLAIALKGQGHDGAQILAKGEGDLAEQILQLAFEQGIRVRTDSNLAEILSHLDVDSAIPLEALAAVATILNYVYQDQARTARRSAQATVQDHFAPANSDDRKIGGDTP